MRHSQLAYQTEEFLQKNFLDLMISSEVEEIPDQMTT